MFVEFYFYPVYICVVFNLQLLILCATLPHNLDYFKHCEINLATHIVWLESVVLDYLLVKQILCVREKKFA